MAKWTLLVVLYIGASWMLLLLPWLQVSDNSLSGAELSELLTLLPTVAILILLISLYGRLVRSLRVFAALVLGFSSVLSFTTDFSKAAASIQLQESLTGISGESSLAQVLLTPVVFGSSQIIGCLMCLALLKTYGDRKTKDSHPETDSRTIWESQN
ncbi:MAG: hypothetical protein RL537_872 [Actinomycetota bacterium]